MNNWIKKIEQYLTITDRTWSSLLIVLKYQIKSIKCWYKASSDIWLWKLICLLYFSISRILFNINWGWRVLPFLSYQLTTIYLFQYLMMIPFDVVATLLSQNGFWNTLANIDYKWHLGWKHRQEGVGNMEAYICQCLCVGHERTPTFILPN